MAILEVTGLSKHFGELEVIRDISFSLEKGESLAIIGSSGSGKTTLLRCLTALETPDTGTIRVSGDTVFDASQPRPKGAQARANQLRFGLVFQSFNLFPQYTALKNVTLAAELLAKERADYKTGKKRILAEIAEKGRAALESVGLSSKADNYPHQLSGGQQQRVAIARALMLEPDILCFDEPDVGARPGADGRGLERHPLAGRPRHDHAHRHPRDAVRPAGGRQRAVHGRRRDRRIRQGGRRHRQPARGAHAQVFGAILQRALFLQRLRGKITGGGRRFFRRLFALTSRPRPI